MDDDSKKVIGGEPETKSEEPKVEPKVEDKASIIVPPEDSKEIQELKAKEEQLANLNKAIAESQEILRKNRKAAKELKKGDDDDLPRIDMEDPSSKAWDRHIRENVAPVQAELEKEKEEVRTFALREFLKDKPALSKDPKKLEAVMATYDRIKTASERTREGVLLDLDRAYAAEYHEELLYAARQARVDDARNNAIFSDIAVTKGSTAYSNTKEEKVRTYSEEEKAILAKWNMTPQQHAEMVKNLKKE